MKGHREKLAQVAKEHGLPPPVGSMTPGTYFNYCADLTLLALGVLKPEEVDVPDPTEPPKKQWSILPW